MIRNPFEIRIYNRSHIEHERTQKQQFYDNEKKRRKITMKNC